MLKHFPSAMGVDDFIARTEVALCYFGFTGDNTIGECRRQSRLGRAGGRAGGQAGQAGSTAACGRRRQRQGRGARLVAGLQKQQGVLSRRARMWSLPLWWLCDMGQGMS